VGGDNVSAATESPDYHATLDLLAQEYRAALRDLYSEDQLPSVRQRRVDERPAEYERKRHQELRAIREQWKEDSSAS
jgi:hypothetical protein